MLRPHGWTKLLGVSQRLLHQSDRGVCSAPHLLTAGVALQTASGSDSGQSLTPWSSCYYMQWLWRLGWSECILHTGRKTVLRHRVPSTWSKFPLIKNKLKRSRKSVWAVSMVSKVLPCLPVTIPAASDRTKRMISVCASCQSTCIAVLVCSVSIRVRGNWKQGCKTRFGEFKLQVSCVTTTPPTTTITMCWSKHGWLALPPGNDNCSWTICSATLHCLSKEASLKTTKRPLPDWQKLQHVLAKTQRLVVPNDDHTTILWAVSGCHPDLTEWKKHSSFWLTKVFMVPSWNRSRNRPCDEFVHALQPLFEAVFWMRRPFLPKIKPAKRSGITRWTSTNRQFWMAVAFAVWAASWC